MVLRDVYTKNGRILTDWTDQLSTDADLDIALKTLGDEFTKFEPPYTSGEFGLTIQTMETFFKKTRVAASTSDRAKLTVVITKLADLITSFDAVCQLMDQ